MKAPAFQFYPKDFLSDVTVIRMSMEARGCYITLLSVCWLEGSIPNDEIMCAQICGYRAEDDSSAIAQVLHCFDSAIDDDSRLVHSRLEKERKKQIEFSKGRSDSGKLGAKSRWNQQVKKEIAKPKLSHGTAIAQPMANDSFAVCSLQSADINTPVVPKGTLEMRLGKLFGKRETTPWDRAERNAWKTAQAVIASATEEEWALVEAFHKDPHSHHRQGLATLLNNWNEEVSRAKSWKSKQSRPSPTYNQPIQRPEVPMYVADPKKLEHIRTMTALQNKV